MGMTLTVYLAPDHDDGTGDAGGFDWEGPALYRSHSSVTADLLNGDALAAVLTPAERALLEPAGALREYDVLRVLDPAAVRGALAKAYAAVAPSLRAAMQADVAAAQRYEAFQRDVSGLVLVCAYAEAEGKGVYVAVW